MPCRWSFSLAFIWAVMDGSDGKAIRVNLHHDTTQQTQGKGRKVRYYSQTNIQTVQVPMQCIAYSALYESKWVLLLAWTALSTMKDIVLSVLRGGITTSFLRNRNTMNAENSEIFYTESATSSLKASRCFPLVVMWRCQLFHSTPSLRPCQEQSLSGTVLIVPNAGPLSGTARLGSAGRARSLQHHSGPWSTSHLCNRDPVSRYWLPDACFLHQQRLSISLTAKPIWEPLAIFRGQAGLLERFLESFEQATNI